jgi:hypothetical protein
VGVGVGDEALLVVEVVGVGVGVGVPRWENVGNGVGVPEVGVGVGVGAALEVALGVGFVPPCGALDVGVLLGLALCDLLAELVALALGLIEVAPPAGLDDPVGLGEFCPAAAPGDRNARNWVRPSAATAMIRTPPATDITTTRRRLPGRPSDFGTWRWLPVVRMAPDWRTSNGRLSSEPRRPASV